MSSQQEVKVITEVPADVEIDASTPPRGSPVDDLAVYNLTGATILRSFVVKCAQRTAIETLRGLKAGSRIILSGMIRNKPGNKTFVVTDVKNV